MASREEREKLVQLRALNAFLASLTALDSDEKRFEKYVGVLDKLHKQLKKDQENWSSLECKNGDLGALVQKIANLHIGDPTHTELSLERSIQHGQRAFFVVFSVFVEKNLREVVVDRGHRRNCSPESQSYNMQLCDLIDTYLNSLDKFILLQVQADDAHRRMYVNPRRIHAAEINADGSGGSDDGSGGSDGSDGSEAWQAGYGSDAELEEKYLRKDITDIQLKMNNEFLEVILFLFAVPQEMPLRARYKKFYGVRLMPPLEQAKVNMNVAWMMDDCLWYQHNQKFMEALADCAVIALMRSYYYLSPTFTEICQSYIDLVVDYEKTDAFAEVAGHQELIDDDSVDNINTRVRSAAHGRRPGRHAADPAVDVPARVHLPAAGSTGADLAALRSIYLH
jgi:hypothetical protein